MRKLIAATFISLDGVLQAPGGPEEDPVGGFKFGGWTAPYFDEALGAVMDELFAQPFDLVLGRKTYEIFAAHWPYISTEPGAPGYDPGEAEIARLFNRATKHVATRTLTSFDWNNSQSLGPDVVATLRKLKASDGPALLLQGSGNLIQTLLAADLIDEFRLLIFPVVLGSGKRLLGPGAKPGALRLVQQSASPSGVIHAVYERAGGVKTGSLAASTPSAAELERRRKLE